RRAGGKHMGVPAPSRLRRNALRLLRPTGYVVFYAALRGAEPRGEAPFTLSVARRERPRGKAGREEASSNHMRSLWPCAGVLFVTRRHRRFSSAVGRNKRSALRRPSQNTLAARKTSRGQTHRPPRAFAPPAQCALLIAPYGLSPRTFVILRLVHPRHHDVADRHQQKP